MLNRGYVCFNDFDGRMGGRDVCHVLLIYLTFLSVEGWHCQHAELVCQVTSGFSGSTIRRNWPHKYQLELQDLFVSRCFPEFSRIKPSPTKMYMARFLWQEIFLCSLPPPSPLAGCAALDVFRAEGRRVEGMAKKRGFTKKMVALTQFQQKLFLSNSFWAVPCQFLWTSLYDGATTTYSRESQQGSQPAGQQGLEIL